MELIIVEFVSMEPNKFIARDSNSMKLALDDLETSINSLILGNSKAPTKIVKKTITDKIIYLNCLKIFINIWSMFYFTSLRVMSIRAFTVA